MSRKLCTHFSHSYHARNALLKLQRQHYLPQHCLICDVPTRWNSSLHMLDRLYEQRMAINELLVQQPASFTQQCNFQLSHWQMMRDTCRLLRPFEEATLLVSREDCGINDVIPMLHELESVLKGYVGDRNQTSAHMYHVHLSPEQDEVLVEEDEEINAQTLFTPLGGLSDGEEHQELEDEEVDEDPSSTWQYSVDSGEDRCSESMMQMATCLLACLRCDSRVTLIRLMDDYWLATLVDPRFRNKMCEFFPPSEREVKLAYYHELLCSRLIEAYHCDAALSQTGHQGDTVHSLSSPMTARGGSSCQASHLSHESLMSGFMQPAAEQSSQHLTHATTQKQLNQQVVEYLESSLSLDNMDPVEFWAGKLDIWPQLAELAMSMLSCPASSVALERIFSTAGAIVTPRRTRLSCQKVEILTFIKMNQAWITPDYTNPVSDATD